MCSSDCFTARSGRQLGLRYDVTTSSRLIWPVARPPLWPYASRVSSFDLIGLAREIVRRSMVRPA